MPRPLAPSLSTSPPTDDRWAALQQDFVWQVPRWFNIAQACCARWARETPQATAIRWERADGSAGEMSYADLQAQANRLSRVLRRQGVRRGDRVAIVLPQRPQTAVAHMAIYQLGAVAMPLSHLFGPEALSFRLNDSQAVLAIVDEGSAEGLRALRHELPHLQQLLAVGAAQGQGDLDWEAALDGVRPDFTPVKTRADEAAVLIYTSGTTGPPKGALIPHRALLGNLSGFVASQNWFGFERRRGRWVSQAVFWSPADWAWTGGLMDALLPTLYFGRPIVAYQGRFDPLLALDLMARHGVTHSFLFPTALKAMMKAAPRPRETFDLKLQAVMSAGEAVGDAVFNWCRDALGVTVNEMFGQTEINYIVGNCTQTLDGQGRLAPGWPARPGSMGRGYPGHRVSVIDEAGRECAAGEAGEVAVHRLDWHGQPDPVFFLGYWRRDDATRQKYTPRVRAPGERPRRVQGRLNDALGVPWDSWCRTGDRAVRDEAGYLWYQGRSDDMFKAAGYRIGPSEIENCLVKHPAVANAAVVPKPDAARGAVVKAYVVLAPGRAGDAGLVEALQALVRSQLAPYEVPKEIEFIEALPMTTTGKVQRRVLRLQEEERARRQG